LSRKLVALAVASTIVLASIGAGAQPIAASEQAHAKNEAPLKPAGAAGIQKAQGIADVDVWFISGLIVASIVAAILLADDDDSSNSTHSTD